MTKTLLDNEFKELISKRCEKALVECKDYMEREHSSEIDQDELQAMAEELCYKKGFQDAIMLLKN